MLEEAGRRGRERWGSSSSSETSEGLSSTPSIPSQQSNTTMRVPRAATLSDGEMLQRARAAYTSEDFVSLAAGPEAKGPWLRVEAVGRFVVFRKQVADSKVGTNSDSNELEVLCAGRLDASLEEVASILRSNSEGELNSAMSALYSKSFIFGSYEREIPCTTDQDDDGCEYLVVKTKSFARTSMLGRNEQWCYFDYFRRKDERDGFTVTKRALPAAELIPGRIVGESTHVDQLYGLNASYLVEKLPDRKGLRVVFRAWFESPESEEDQARDSRSTLSRSSRRQSSNSSSSSGSQSKINRADTRKYKERMGRLLAMAHGVTHLPKLVRRRRFGLQEPADRSAIQAQNTRCPCGNAYYRS
ncbi:hypothetical protein PF005_g28551 [Phytophthora fragariae]|nr:hypothetical protein PF009_g27325 [Phytophthora fragariae]KAE9065594.1 hypothetical protein PF010_g28136 [Phytophthora fragariae]KAE9168042.1 hypothetical protein PF005_g28551 [Phytophthora fragariae]KAE9208517.1 hypothetical protein PF002_g19379 [Phytophthora fragariae]KAE9271505.1 hypothetical protein PF001_g28347 [Phytophthora fragariae]